MSNVAIDRTLLKECKREMNTGKAMHHPFLLRIAEGVLKPEQLPLFIIHWYKTAEAHRKAFPGLIANIKNDEIRFELINILYEEYGSGDRSKIHVRILNRLLSAFGLTQLDVKKTITLTSTTEFDDIAADLWSNGDDPLAYSLHYGLEYLASSQQKYFSIGMNKYDFLSSYDREYFNIHAEAEPRHVMCSEPGFLFYAENIENHEKLKQGILIAERLLCNLWDEFDLLFFPA